MSARHQLAAELSAAAQVEGLADDILGDPLHYADFVLAAGWRPPVRTVSTVEELDALPLCSIVREDGGTSFERLRSGWDCLTTDGSDGLWASAKVAAAAPLTVIFKGGA